MATLFEPGTEIQPERQKGPPPRRKASRWTGVAFVLALIGIVLGVVALLMVRSERNQLRADLRATQGRLTSVETRALGLDTELTGVKSETSTIADRVGLTQKELEHARALARTVNGKQSRQLDSLGGAIDQAKASIVSQNEALGKTNAQLQTAIGDLGHESGLIARNHDELQQLKLSSEHTYIDFHVKKSDGSTQVGPVAIRLKHADTRHNRFTVVVTVGDKRIERKNRTLYEPIQFYPKGHHWMDEIVVYQLSKNEATGYLSEPRQAATAKAPAATS